MPVKNLPGNILLIDKPKGITSFDVIRILRKKLGTRKMGHAGTLDPLATGLIIVGIGDGTKQLKDYIGLPKVYEAEILLGVKTTTGDLEGTVIDECAVMGVDEVRVVKILRQLKGQLHLPVPIYSAVKQRGKPLYARARHGEEVSPPTKEMEILWIKLTGISKEDHHIVVMVELEVTSGTYIRSIAEEIGERLGFPATLKNLRRTQIGEFKIKFAKKL